MEEFLHFLDGRMTTPTWFGWFHIMWLVITLAACVLIYLFRKKISPKAVNITILVAGIVMILFEVYKQINFSFNYVPGGGSYWDYQWYAFPFQFCSTPLYIMLLAGILRKGKVYSALTSYLATFALIAGLMVMVYPGDVFISTIGINIQTMVVHCGMFVIGFLLLATRTVKLEYKNVFKALIVFVIMAVLALAADIIWHFYGNGETFNMFFISPYLPCTLPVLSMIYDKVPYAVFLIIYFVGFLLCALIVMSFAKLFAWIESKCHKHNDDADTEQREAEIVKSESEQ